MDVCIENVQGFKGKFSYSLDALINVITAKHNGTGKTTFFDCIKLLCKPNIFTKEEIKFFINKECTFCNFNITTDEGITYGFEIFKPKIQVRYYRFYDDEEGIEESNVAFPEACQDLDVFIKGDTIINICDRFIDLFSSSSERLNYKLIQDLTSHEELNLMITRAEESLKINKEHLGVQQQEVVFVNKEMQSTRYFENADAYEDLLNQEDYINIHDNFLDIYYFIEKLESDSYEVSLLPTASWFNLFKLIEQYTPDSFCVNEYPVTHFNKIYMLVDQYIPDTDIIETGLYSNLVTCQNLLNQYLPDSTTLDTSCYLSLINLLELITAYQVVPNTSIFDNFVICLEALQRVQPTTKVKPITLINQFASIYGLLVHYFKNLEIILDAEIRVASLKDGIKDHKQDCPLYGEVYIVGEECVHV